MVQLAADSSVRCIQRTGSHFRPRDPVTTRPATGGGETRKPRLVAMERRKTTTPAARAPRVPVILLVEDNPGDCQMVGEALRCGGFACTLVCVPNAVLAFQFLQKRGAYKGTPQADLILLDLNLPVIKGHDFLTIMKAEALWSRIPVVVFSSSDSQQDIENSIRLGAVRYMVKPSVWDGYLAAAQRLRADWQELCGAA